MKNPVINLFVAVAFVAVGVMPAMSVNAASQRGSYGPWTVTTLSRDNGDWRVETFKLDRGIVAWTEVNDASFRRRLYAYDGLETRLLGEWSSVEGDYPRQFPGGDESRVFDDTFDVSDGVVVWRGNANGFPAAVGDDYEIYELKGGVVSQVSNPGYRDYRPRVSNGRIVWTSFEPSGTYNLMTLDRYGTYRIDSWPVLNYEFSGDNLYWLNRLPGEDWFRVFVNDGVETRAVGKGDDRNLAKYFVTDDDGSAAWEYSTKQWSYDKREIFVSVNGAEAHRTLQRDVPPMVTELMDVHGPRTLVSVHDLLTTKLDDWNLLDTGPGWEATVTTAIDSIRVRAFDDGIVRHVVPENGSPLIVRYNDGFEDWMSLERVIHNMFEADDDVIAAGRIEGGVLLNTDRKTTLIPSDGIVKAIDTRGGDAAWIIEENGVRSLEMASRGLMVHVGQATKTVAGRLVKTPDSPDVYLAATDGNRYVFSDEGVFSTWYPDFGSVTTVATAQVAAMPLAGSVAYRPGSVLVKTKDSPRVYMVAKDGGLRWVNDASVLVAKYGTYWPSYVRTIPDADVWSYTFGPSVGTVDTYDVALTSTR